MQLVADPVFTQNDLTQELISKEQEDYKEKLRNEEEFNRRVRDRILALVKWTDEELSWIKDDGCTQRLGKAFARRVKAASTGCFVSQWNFGKVTDICDILSRLDIEIREGRLNGWCEDEGVLLKTLLTESPSGFSWHRLIHYITSLRLCRLQISEMDHSLSRLIQLKALILTSNLIKKFSGYLLPRDLRFLELYNNSIESLNEFVDGAPEKIFYLGIGRNRLVNSESLMCLSFLNHLHYLDVSDNDFLRLPDCMSTLKCLPNLVYLSIYGTPISMAISYRRIAAMDLPELILFDGIYVNKICHTEMQRPESAGKKKKADKGSAKKNKNTDESVFDLTGELQAYLFRVYGVPKPKAEKNVKNLYYFELECPLLDTTLKDFMAQRIREEDEAERRRLLGLDKEDDGEGQDEDGKGKNRDSQNIGEGDGTGKGGKRGVKNDEDIDGKGGKGKGKDKGGKDRDGKDKDGKYKGGKGRSGKSDSKSMMAGKNDTKCDSKKEDKTKYLFPVSHRCSDRYKDKALIDSERAQNKDKSSSVEDENDKNKKENDQNKKDKDGGEGSKARSKNSSRSKDGKATSSQGGKSKKGAQSIDGEGKGKSADKGKNDENINKSKRNKGDNENKEPTVEDNLNSILSKDAEIEGATQFKSKEIEWSRVLEFKQPIVINTSDLLSLRDTFRTTLKFRLIHKKMKMNKNEVKSKKLKKKPDPNEDPDKNVLLKEKLAVIPVPLEAIKWNQKYLGYKWDIENPCLAEKCPDVKDLKFAKGDSARKKSSSSAKKKKAPLLPEPKILTALLGVGVKRDTYT